MSEGVMNIGALNSPDLARGVEREQARPEIRDLRPAAQWNPANFAQEQIRGLVRKVFFSGSERPVRQIVFSAVEPETDVRSICRRVGEVLAAETSGSVVVARGFSKILQDHANRENKDGCKRLRQIATQARENLWLLPATKDGNPATAASLNQHLSEIRREFEFSIVEGRSMGESIEALAMAQFADGIILVLSARHTRRATAHKIKEALEGSRARLMGTVLSDRLFPIPDAIYRRL
jgi:hypothetical protein